MLSVAIQAFRKVDYVTLARFANFCLIYSDWAFEIPLRSSSARLDPPCAAQIHLIGIQVACEQALLFGGVKRVSLRLPKWESLLAG